MREGTICFGEVGNDRPPDRVCVVVCRLADYISHILTCKQTRDDLVYTVFSNDFVFCPLATLLGIGDIL